MLARRLSGLTRIMPNMQWSSEVETGIRDALEGSGAELQVIRMDTKRNPGDGFGQQAGADALAAIEGVDPDLVIACDDNAQKYLVMPFLNDTDIPVVFCGVNWDASRYDFSTNNVTGVVEVELPDQVVEILKPYTQGEQVAYLTVASETEDNVIEIYNERFLNGQMKTLFCGNFRRVQSCISPGTGRG